MKLPKEMQKKEKNRPKRPTPAKKRQGQQQFGSRQMRRKMASQGIDMDQIEATRVIIEGPEKTLIIEQPEVVLMKQMGQEIYQVIGSAEEYSPDEVTVTDKEELKELEPLKESEIKPTITENDIMLVAAQGNVDPKEAEAVLRDCEGDIAKAILLLKNRS
ncbi:MAG: nascent polypeptide-associated complex protein [Promethearchaeota archaeon]